jgi:hypothetical protein
MFTRYLETPLTVAHHRGEIWFYHLHLIERYPTLWPLFPFLAVFAVAARPKPSTFALCRLLRGVRVRLLRRPEKLALSVFRAAGSRVARIMALTTGSTECQEPL